MLLKKALNYIFIIFLVVEGFFIFGKDARAIEISDNVSWTKADSPVIVNESVRVKAGGNLTIESGVVVKFNSGQGLATSGQLNTEGTKEEPIIFTSIKDDQNGGDSNNDGSSTLPEPGDWWYLSFSPGSVSELNFVEIKYGGGENYTGAIIIYKGTLNINNSVIIENAGGIANRQGQLTVNNSSIYNNYVPFIGGIMVDAGISNNNNANIIVEAKNNWWGNADGPCPWRELSQGIPVYQINIEELCGGKALVDVGVVFDPWLTALPIYDELTEPDPVIIVPGIMGSWNLSGKWELDPILHTYDNLWEALKLAGYIEDETLFAFPYQWRQSNNYSAVLLKDKITEVKNICQCDKVDIVAHSMGGLVARAYIEGNDYQSDIDQLIFLATPHKGSPKTYLTWESGEVGQTSRDYIFERIFLLVAIFNNYANIFQYVRGLPVETVQELLPIYNYLRDKETMELRTYPNNYPVNTFLEGLNNQSQLDKLNQVRGVNIIAKAGEESTINYFRVVEKDFVDGTWEHGYPENYSLPFTDHGLEYGPGDNTVPEISNLDFAGLDNIIIESNHNDIVTDAQKFIIKELTGVEPGEEVRKNIFTKIFMVRIFSPADFLIIAPDNSILGKDFSNNQAVNEIPNAFYSGFNNDIEFAVIPEPLNGEYEIILQGTDIGEYKLSASYINEEKVIDKEFSGNILSGVEHKFSININSEAEEPTSDLVPQGEYVVTINSAIEDIEEIYNLGYLKNKGEKNSLINELKKLDNKLKVYDLLISGIEKLIEKTENSKIKDKAKEKIINALNKRLEKTLENKKETIEKELNNFEKKIDKLLEQDKINQAGYDIINNDIYFLKINL
ncbi:MAG: hypothetical protein ABH830_03630 [Patescibacteria group bacterium]